LSGTPTWKKARGAKRGVPIVSQTILFIKWPVEKLLYLRKFRIPKVCKMNNSQ
jgi:hypothetical protein